MSATTSRSDGPLTVAIDDSRCLLGIVPATGGRGFSRFSAQATLILFEISGIATG